jgi:dUTP pyrophosphatase
MTDNLIVGVKALSPHAKLPQYAHSDDSGADLYSCLPLGPLSEAIVIGAGEWKLIPTGIAIELPAGFEAQVRSRSGLSLKNGLFCLNGIVTIDTSYRGECGVILANFSKEDYYVEHHVRIAQLVISPIQQAIFYQSDVLSDTVRGAGGYGSSGTK